MKTAIYICNTNYDLLPPQESFDGKNWEYVEHKQRVENNIKISDADFNELNKAYQDNKNIELPLYKCPHCNGLHRIKFSEFLQGVIEG